MKIYLSILFLLFSFSLWAQPSKTEQSTKRTQYYNAGMAASVAHYDSVIQRLVQQRYEKKLSETEFTATYNSYENQYKAQLSILAEMAIEWAQTPLDSCSKNIRSALALVAKGKPTLALSQLQQKLYTLKNKKTYKELHSDYWFLAKLNQFVGDNYKALEVWQLTLKAFSPDPVDYIKDAEFGASKFMDSFKYELVKCADLSGKTGQDSLAMEYLTKAKELSKNDVIGKVTVYSLIGAMHGNEPLPNDATAALIDAEYLLEQSTPKAEWQQYLLGPVLSKLAGIQLHHNDFDNAVRNGKRSVAILESIQYKPELGAAYATLALTYKRAGANKEADTLYQKAIALYSDLASEYPEHYNPILADVLDEYGAVHKWFDRNDSYDKNLRQSMALRKQLMATHYPFFALEYAKNLVELGQKKLNIDLKVYLAEAQWKEARDVLVNLNAKHPMMAGNELCNALYKVGGVKFSLDSAIDAKPAFAQSLAVREYLYRLAPTANKFGLMNLLYQNASLNTLSNKSNELAIEQLSRAKMLADELGDARYATDIQALKLEILKK